jgi:LEA14-like dessication related protein
MKLMNWKRAQFLLGVCSLFAIGFGCFGCATTDNKNTNTAPEVMADSRKLEITKQNLTDLSLSEEIGLSNSESSPLKVLGAHWEIVFDGNVIQSGDQRLDVTVPPNGSATVTLEGSGTYAKDAEAVQKLSEHRGGFPISLRGTLSVAGANGSTAKVDFAKANNVREPRMPQVKMEDASASHYDDGHVNVSFSFAIDNPNPFPVQVAAFNYKVDVSGFSVAEESKGQNVEVPASSKKVFEETQTLDPATFKDLPDLYKKNTMRYAVTGTLDLGLAKKDVQLEGPLNFPNH